MLKRYPVKWRQDYRINARKLRDGNREDLGKRLRCYLKSCRKWRKISHLLRKRNRRTAAKKQQEQKNYNSKDDITVRLSSFNGFRKKIFSETDGTYTVQGPTEVRQQSLKYRDLVIRWKLWNTMIILMNFSLVFEHFALPLLINGKKLSFSFGS